MSLTTGSERCNRSRDVTAFLPAAAWTHLRGRLDRRRLDRLLLRHSAPVLHTLHRRYGTCQRGCQCGLRAFPASVYMAERDLATIAFDASMSRRNLLLVFASTERGGGNAGSAKVGAGAGNTIGGALRASVHGNARRPHLHALVDGKPP